MRILGLERDNTACNSYRVLQPLYKLRQLGLADTLTLGDYELHTDNAVNKVMEADIVLFQRPANEDWFKFIKLCQKHGKIIVLDYDDDPFNTSPLNPYYKFVGTKNYAYKWPTGEVDMVWQDGENGFDIERNIMRNDLFRASFRKADLVTCTTDYLRENFLTLNDNVAVLPNLIDFYYYRKYDMVKKDVRILYQGGASHYEDLYIIKDIIKEVLRKNDNAKFVYFGDMRLKNLFQEIPTSRVEFHSWVQHISYPYLLSLMNVDIGICPLADNEFNNNKSCLKWLDYSTQHAVTVASDRLPYSPVIKEGETGFLASTPKEWVEKITMLCKSPETRLKVGKNAYECVYEEWNADKKAHLWLEAYEKLLKVEV